jgi:UDP-GlcNAc3NAcA epimerase
MKKKILTILGARPQFIKAASLSRELKGSVYIEETIIHTGQHFDRDMSDVFFEELEIPDPKYMLNISGGSHGQMTGRMLEALDSIIIQEKPSAVLVYGDTNSTLAGALSASKLHVPLIHIESGLRSFNKKMPEEINRILTDHISDILFCSTETAVDNLQKEGILKGVYFVGDIMYDSTLHAITRIEHDKSLEKKFSYLQSPFALMTIHRAESTQSINEFQKILNFAAEFAINNELNIIFTVHPRTRKIMERLPVALNKRFILLEPLSYLETQYCLTKASYVLTDSGGMQKEAYFHHVPCVTLRSETEWVETIENGWNRLWINPCYKDRKNISDYGNGTTANSIIKILEELL